MQATKRCVMVSVCWLRVTELVSDILFCVCVYVCVCVCVYICVCVCVCVCVFSAV